VRGPSYIRLSTEMVSEAWRSSEDCAVVVVGGIDMMIEYSTVRGWIERMLNSLDPELNVALSTPPPSVPTTTVFILDIRSHELD